MKYIAVVLIMIGSFIIGYNLGYKPVEPMYNEVLFVNGFCRNTDNIAPWVK